MSTCNQLTIQEHADLILQNPNAVGFDTQEECEQTPVSQGGCLPPCTDMDLGLVYVLTNQAFNGGYQKTISCAGETSYVEIRPAGVANAVQCLNGEIIVGCELFCYLLTDYQGSQARYTTIRDFIGTTTVRNLGDSDVVQNWQPDTASPPIVTGEYFDVATDSWIPIQSPNPPSCPDCTQPPGVTVDYCDPWAPPGSPTRCS
jgi:hypothetical protein